MKERRLGEGEVGKEEGERRAAMTGLERRSGAGGPDDGIGEEEGEVHRKGLVSVIHRVHHEVE